MNHASVPQNHYDVLLLDSRQALSLEIIKRAYHRALLLSHPDKSNVATPLRPKYTIDQITHAYNVLKDPSERSSFDRSIRLNNQNSTLTKKPTESDPTGEVVDLDELEYDDKQNLWYRACRCGQERGFMVTESDLEKRTADGEALVGCQGCSLWIKVLFAAQDEG